MSTSINYSSSQLDGEFGLQEQAGGMKMQELNKTFTVPLSTTLSTVPKKNPQDEGMYLDNEYYYTLSGPELNEWYTASDICASIPPHDEDMTYDEPEEGDEGRFEIPEDEE